MDNSTCFKKKECEIVSLLKRYRFVLCLGVVLFIGFFAYFSMAHSLYIYDTDDWTYISYSRVPWPTVKQWNPSKVLPEILMPLVSEIGVRCLYPITKDYIEALNYTHSFFISLLITVYLLCYLKLFKILKVNGLTKYLLVCVITLLHFLPYNVDTTQNQNLFYAGNLTHLYNYTVPGLFNAILLFLIIEKYEVNLKLGNIETGAILLLAYLCINSNLFHSIILVSWALSVLMIEMIKVVASRKELKIELLMERKCAKIPYFLQTFLFKGWFYIYVLILFVMSAIFESKGDRAQWASGITLINLPIMDTLKILIRSVVSMRRVFIIFSLLLAILFFVLVIRFGSGEKPIVELMLKLVVALCITIVYTILLCAKVGSFYISRSSVQLSFMIYFMIIICLCLGYISVKLPQTNSLIPFFVLMMVSFTVVDGKTFADNNCVHTYRLKTIKMLDDSIISQVIEAEERGESEVTVKVPKYDSEDNFPIATYGGNRISATLFRHGVTHRIMKITIVPDENINRIYALK